MIESWILNELFQDLTDPFLIMALVLVVIHFGTPLAYYWYAKTQWLPKPWNIRVDGNYRPKVTVIVPTYNEAGFIEKKLDNVYQQDYPRDKVEVIVVDSASNDGTPEKVKQWSMKHPDFHVKLVQEPVRRGMAHALRTGFSYVKGDVVVITDADAIWEDPDTLKEVVKWLSCKGVGAVSCIKVPYRSKGFEETYRQYYNVLRVAESRAWSTPIFHGELSAFKKEFLEKVGGFPLGVGSAESLAAMKIAALGYRAITPDTITVSELIPQSNYVWWRIRRAQHLILHLVKTLRYLKHYNSSFKQVVLMEAYFHLINPWLFITGAVLLLYATLALRSILSLIFLALGLVLLPIRLYRVWITNQLFLVVAQLRNLWRKELVWSKQKKL